MPSSKVMPGSPGSASMQVDRPACSSLHERAAALHSRIDHLAIFLRRMAGVMRHAKAHLARSGSESTRMTPREAAPEMGLMTAGKPTCLAAAGRSFGLRMR